MSSKTLGQIFGKVILLDLKAKDKHDILSQIVTATCKKHKMAAAKSKTLLSKVIAREELGSTGIGSGAAVPHAKVKNVKSLIGAFARSREPIDYDAVDGEPVQLFFLLVSPDNGAAGYLEALSTLSRSIRDKKFCNFLRSARNKKDVLYTLNEIQLNSIRGG